MTEREQQALGARQYIELVLKHCIKVDRILGSESLILTHVDTGQVVVVPESFLEIFRIGPGAL